VLDKDNIILFGRSLGGAAALSLAAELNRTERDLKIRALILENTFLNVPALMSHLMPLISAMSALVTNSWHSDDRISELDPELPVLFLSGGSDELIPPPMMAALFEKCPCVKKEMAHFPGGTP
jgi:pimeloyl-ACP methyl ester carboxylesterase